MWLLDTDKQLIFPFPSGFCPFNNSFKKLYTHREGSSLNRLYTISTWCLFGVEEWSEPIYYFIRIVPSDKLIGLYFGSCWQSWKCQINPKNVLACLSPLRIFIYATFLCGFSCFGYFFNNIVHSNTSSQPYSPIVHFTFVQDKFNFSIVQNPHLNLALLTYAGEWDPNPQPEIFTNWLRRSGSEVLPLHYTPGIYFYISCFMHF